MKFFSMYLIYNMPALDLGEFDSIRCSHRSETYRWMGPSYTRLLLQHHPSLTCSLLSQLGFAHELRSLPCRLGEEQPRDIHSRFGYLAFSRFCVLWVFLAIGDALVIEISGCGDAFAIGSCGCGEILRVFDDFAVDCFHVDWCDFQ